MNPEQGLGMEESVATLPPPHRPSLVTVQRLYLYLCSLPCPPVVLTAPFLSFSPQTSLMKVPEDACTPVVPTHCPASLHAVWATMTLESRAWDAICSFLLPRSAPIWDTWWLRPLALPPSPSPPAFLQPLLGGAWGFYYTDIVPVPRTEWVREVTRFTYRRAQILKGSIRER